MPEWKDAKEQPPPENLLVMVKHGDEFNVLARIEAAWYYPDGVTYFTLAGEWRHTSRQEREDAIKEGRVFWDKSYWAIETSRTTRIKAWGKETPEVAKAMAIDIHAAAKSMKKFGEVLAKPREAVGG